jgi:hypothetical protein
LEILGLHSLGKRRHNLDVIFFQVYLGLKSCTSILENISLRVASSNLREFSLLSL